MAELCNPKGNGNETNDNDDVNTDNLSDGFDGEIDSVDGVDDTDGGVSCFEYENDKDACNAQDGCVFKSDSYGLCEETSNCGVATTEEECGESCKWDGVECQSIFEKDECNSAKNSKGERQCMISTETTSYCTQYSVCEPKKSK